MADLKRLFLALLLLTSLGCVVEEDNEEDEIELAVSSALAGRWVMTGFSCDGVSGAMTASNITSSYSMWFESSSSSWTSAASDISDLTDIESCGGSYVMSGVSDDGTTLSFTVPDAATVCTNEDFSTVDSCTIGSYTCSTSGSGTQSLSYTYSLNEGTLTLTGAGTDNSVCSAGQAEVLTFSVGTQ